LPSTVNEPAALYNNSPAVRSISPKPACTVIVFDGSALALASKNA